jgi:hypothetical protein
VECALKAADDRPAIPKDRASRLALFRRALIPWLAGIDPETGSPQRRVARRSDLPPESLPLVDLLVEQRLLSADIAKDTGEVTIEPAHEALLRQWSLLEGWLAEDAGLLGVVEGIKRASRDWTANGKDPAWLAHAKTRLEAAERLRERPDLEANLAPADRAYLAECRKREDAELGETKAARGRTLRMRAIAATLAVLAVLAGWRWYESYLQVSGQCWVASVYSYETGRFEQEGANWVEYKGDQRYAVFRELRQDATYVYMADDNRRQQIEGREDSAFEVREFLVRIPKCGGEAEWSWSNPLRWTAFQIVTAAD